ncbi:NAD-dependent epimerase/dehydratase family protein [Candidatus Peregrinibacteria bacterium]|nr:MAG: NAD-dependent epimerase/dehydratase family protein [Candidatus Peregrinibacteria bacterium]
MQRKRILVTGGAGFIGSNFCNTHRKNHDIIALDNLLLGDRENLHSEVSFLEGDATKKEDLQKIGSADIILHLAGSSSAPMFQDNLAEAYINSVASFVKVLEWAQEVGVKKVLYASTSSLYGNNPVPLTENQHVVPPNHYAVTKFLYEQCSACFCRTNPEIDVIGFRFMSVYGPNEEAKGKYANIVSQFAWDIARGKTPIIYGDGTQFRDFTHVSDVVQGITLAMETKEKLGAEIFNIGTGSACTLNEIVDSLAKAFEKDVLPKYIENPVKELYVHGQCADITKIRTILGYEPKMTLVEGIRDQVKNLRLEKIRETSSDYL